MSKQTREKFTTTLDPDVIQKLGMLKAYNRKKGMNDVIEELVNRKWEESNINDNNKEKGQATR